MPLSGALSEHWVGHHSRPTRFLISLLAAMNFQLSACTSNGDGVTLFNAGRFAEAHDLLEVAAAGGDADAQNRLAILYYAGLGVPRDFEIAAKWLERAAQQGDASAQLNFGLLYLNGQGVAKDHERAFGWLQAALDAGNPRAQNYLAVLTDNLTPNQMVRGREAVRRRIRQARPIR